MPKPTQILRALPSSRWKPAPEFPLSLALRAQLPKTGRSPLQNRVAIVSEQLSDDIVRRLAPFLQRNAPVDILDINPGAGLLSCKINKLLNPRRHVLIEPGHIYDEILGPLVKSRPSCYKLVKTTPPGLGEWKTLIDEHLPEQGPSNTNQSGGIPMNDTLLVLVNIQPPKSARDHFSGDRWLAWYIEQAIQQAGAHCYGAVRTLISAISTDVVSLLPRSIKTRARPALLAEQVARHAFEVAMYPVPPDREAWAYQRNWDSITAIAKRVEQRTSENNVVVPAGREMPPIKMAANSRDFGGRNTGLFQPRAQTPGHAKLTDFLAHYNSLGVDSLEREELKAEARTVATKLAGEDRQINHRVSLVSKEGQIDEAYKSIARAAADPESTLATIKPMVQRAKELRASVDDATSKLHFDITRAIPQLTDDKRATFRTDNVDHAILLNDRRPFEPLVIHERELFPREEPRTWLYFEPEPNSSTMRRFKTLGPDASEVAYRFSSILGSSMARKGAPTVAKVIELCFPKRTQNELVKLVPSLALHAAREPKPNFDELPKTLHYNADDLPAGQEPDPAACYQENLDYDLSNVSMRTLTVEAIRDLSAEYALEGNNDSIVQMGRLLGATMTAAQTKDTGVMKKRW